MLSLTPQSFRTFEPVTSLFLPLQVAFNEAYSHIIAPPPQFQMHYFRIFLPTIIEMTDVSI